MLVLGQISAPLHLSLNSECSVKTGENTVHVSVRRKHPDQNHIHNYITEAPRTPRPGESKPQSLLTPRLSGLGSSKASLQIEFTEAEKVYLPITTLGLPSQKDPTCSKSDLPTPAVKISLGRKGGSKFQTLGW